MVPEGTQSDILQQLGVSYPELIDYFSKQHTATLVGPTPLMACRRFTQIELGSSLCFGTANMELYHYPVCTFCPPS